jgi:hypothetical protein
MNIFFLNPDSFRNNNVQGLIVAQAHNFAIQDQFTGTPQDNGYPAGTMWLTEANLTGVGYTGTIAGWNAAVATCINRNPKFNDAAGEDFTLQSDSPHIRRAQNGIDNIGGTKIATSLVNTNHDGVNIIVDPSPEINTSNPNSFILHTGQTEGFIDYIINLNGVFALDEIDLQAELLFDSDFSVSLRPSTSLLIHSGPAPLLSKANQNGDDSQSRKTTDDVCPD